MRKRKKPYKRPKGDKIDTLNFSWYHFNIYRYVFYSEGLCANESQNLLVWERKMCYTERMRTYVLEEVTHGPR
jgi:hypothetical protein